MVGFDPLNGCRLMKTRGKYGSKRDECGNLLYDLQTDSRQAAVLECAHWWKNASPRRSSTNV